MKSPRRRRWNARRRCCPCSPVPEKRSHDYIRHGTTALFAVLEAATGKVTGACYPQHRHEEFLAFLKQVAKTYPRVPLHIVCDNYGTHTHPDVRAWLARHPRITLHFTPTSGSWLNMVEVFFGIITRQAIRRGSFTSVQDLITAIETFIDRFRAPPLATAQSTGNPRYVGRCWLPAWLPSLYEPWRLPSGRAAATMTHTLGCGRPMASLTNGVRR